MFLPDYPKTESIGDPQLFCGREKELALFLKWADGIPRRISKSRVLVAAKKMGKTAVLERLYNILYVKKGRVIPFFYRIKDEKVSILDFAEKFYRSFMTQYLSFKLDQPEWVNQVLTLQDIKSICKQNQLEALSRDLVPFEEFLNRKVGSLLWDHASEAPHRMASVTGDSFLQLIDEFQYLDYYIYTDNNFQVLSELAGTYMSVAESKVAPLLVSGSYLGWLAKIVQRLISRFTMIKLPLFSVEDSFESIYRYADLSQVKLMEDGGLAIHKMARNHPYYISSLINSSYSPKNLTTKKGVKQVYDYEVEDERGEIQRHWQEYIEYAFNQTNGRLAKAIILYLSQNFEEEKTRIEILEHLKKKKITLENGDELNDRELEKRLILLARSDVITRAGSDFRFKGIEDEVFNQVVQLLFIEEIDQIKREETKIAIRQQNKEILEKEELVTYRKNKGYLLEFMMISYLKYTANKKGSPPLEKLTQNLPESVLFVPYQTVGGYHFNLPDGHHRQFDVLAKSAQEGQSSLLIECKYWEKPVDSNTIEEVVQKAKEVSLDIPDSKVVPIFYSVSGFTAPALERMKELCLAWSTPEYWNILSGKKN